MNIDTTNLKHIAFIMDGNGRWAKLRNKPRYFGHKKGVSNVLKIMRECYKLNIKNVSFFCFSTENWNRPQKEIDHLFDYLEDFFNKNIKEMMKKGIKLVVSGDILKLRKSSQDVVNKCLDLTKNNKTMIFNVCLNYGGRDDIIFGIKNLVKEIKENDFDLKDLNEETFKKYLYTKDMPDVDLLIRTSGEERISNFMLYQLAYAELIFTKTYWPDFDVNQLHECIDIFNSRTRRFGKI